ncbi:MAG: non-ribosomal peptide synthetase, partial [Ktedonobacteraceae bacterium]|nr:non-ribosomal peptide synthetase [Ktedonobacteraceae bacterium]
MNSNANDLIANMTPEQRKALLLRLAQEKQAKPKLRPLSFAQQRLWFLDQLEPESPLYNIPIALTIEGPLKSALLERAIQEIIARHEALRTTFTVVDEQPVQVIAPHLVLHLQVQDLSMYSPAQQEREIQCLAQEEAQRPFQLSKGPLLRASLLHGNPDRHALLLTVHHIVADGWSTRVFMHELTTLYRAFSQGLPSPLPPLSIQYADFALWQREWLQASILEKQQEYWRHKLLGAPALLSLPSDFPRPTVQAFQGARESFVIAQETSAQLKALSKRERVTLFIAVLSAFYVFLYRYSGQEDLVIGTPIANRTRTEVEPLIGVFINTLALRTRISEHMSFREIIGRIRETCVDAYNNQDLPFEQLIEILQPERSLGYTPLFQVMFGLQEGGLDEFRFPELTFTPLKRDIYTSKFDLSLDIVATSEGMRCIFEYRTDLFLRETIQRMIGHFQRTLAALLT